MRPTLWGANAWERGHLLCAVCPKRVEARTDFKSLRVHLQRGGDSELDPGREPGDQVQKFSRTDCGPSDPGARMSLMEWVGGRPS